MAVLSMTGYGKTEFYFKDKQCTIEIRSVNNRFLDIVTKIPKEISFIENDLKALVKSKLYRGTINISITLKTSETEAIPVSYNEKAIEALLKITNEIKAKYNVTGNVSIENILTLPDILIYENNSEDSVLLKEKILENTEIAVQDLIEMRKQEGANLILDLKKRILHLEQLLDEIKILDPRRIVSWKEKFQERLKILLNDTEIDETRLLQEASIIADKLDINEEITRFKSHNKLFLSILEASGAQGKKLNFVLQEMGREANTLGTKSQDAKIQALAIELKDEVESMREQIMNIE